MPLSTSLHPPTPFIDEYKRASGLHKTCLLAPHSSERHATYPSAWEGKTTGVQGASDNSAGETKVESGNGNVTGTGTERGRERGGEGGRCVVQ